MQTTRFQLALSDSDVRSRLYSKAGVKLGLALTRSIRKHNGSGRTRWFDGEKERTNATVLLAAEAMLKHAARTHERARIRTIPSGDEQSVHLWTLIDEVTDISTQIPAAAHKANGPAIAAMLGFHEELSLVFEDYRTLGGYVPRPVKPFPDGWEVGEPWPENAYASEHAWADADDAGKDNHRGGYDVGETLHPFLVRVTRYVLANRERLGMVDHIFDGHRWHQRDGFAETPYTGSDPHATHTHTAFAEHNGARPPWL